jgi:hypothetical protein
VREVARVAEVAWRRDLEISKTDVERRLVFGWLSVAKDEQGNLIEDLQGDVIDPAELERAAYDFVLYSRQAGDVHERTKDIGRLVESMVFTREKMTALGVPEGTLPEGWWVGFYVDDDEVWNKIKSGEYQGFSIGGQAIREQIPAA